jgi:hypothetical protein
VTLCVVKQPSATIPPAEAITITEAARRSGRSRPHFYRTVKAGSPWFDPELAALVRRWPSGTPYVLADELDALLRSRCFVKAAGQGTGEAAA